MKRILFALVAILAVSGCASTKMQVSATQQLATPAADQSQIIFLRTSSFGGAIQASLFQVTEGAPNFIGIISTGKKIAYTVEPGEHTFMVVSEAADFLEADLLAGKTYFAMVTPRMGAWKARFSLFPVRMGGDGDFVYESEQFQRWLSTTDLIENTENSEVWAKENMSSIIKKQKAYEEVWTTKSADALEERTLRQEDGI